MHNHLPPHLVPPVHRLTRPASLDDLVAAGHISQVEATYLETHDLAPAAVLAAVESANRIHSASDPQGTVESSVWIPRGDELAECCDGVPARDWLKHCCDTEHLATRLGADPDEAELAYDVIIDIADFLLAGAVKRAVPGSPMSRVERGSSALMLGHGDARRLEVIAEIDHHLGGWSSGGAHLPHHRWIKTHRPDRAVYRIYTPLDPRTGRCHAHAWLTTAY